LGSISIVSWIFLLAIVAVIVWPIVIILKRMGFSGWWSLIFFVPFGSIVGLWVLARVQWPNAGLAPATLNKTFE
jgi:hypothetical protein